MNERYLHPDLTPWQPTATTLPLEWEQLITDLSSDVRGTFYRVMDVKYDGQCVGDMLRGWGLPWPVAGAGYLLPYDKKALQNVHLSEVTKVLSQRSNAIHYVDSIEDDDLFTLLKPPYDDLGARLIAVAVYYQALQALLQHSNGQLLTAIQQEQVKNKRSSLINFAKRLGMWQFKREVEDLCEQLLYPVKFLEEKQEYTVILERDQPELEGIRQYLMAHYQQVTGQSSMVTFTACGVAGMRRREQDAHTTAWTAQKMQLTGFDLIIFDIVVPTVHECYATLGVLNQLGYIQDRVTDQIAHPKPNGYSYIALGLTLKPVGSLVNVDMGGRYHFPCQIQIGTHMMQAITRYGCLYPPCYKLYTTGTLDEGAEPPCLEKSWYSEEGNVFWAIKEALAMEAAQSDTLSILQERKQKPITVYDKNRVPVPLPKGATALDFAYALDSAMGERTVEAFINNRKAHISRVLEAGDIVEIRTSEETQAQDYWLDEDYATTPEAKHHIKKALRRRSLEHRGFNQILRILERHHYRLTPEELYEQLSQLLKRHHLGPTQRYLEELDLTEEAPSQYTPEWVAQQIIRRIAERNDLPSEGKPRWVPVLDNSSSSEQYRFRPLHHCGTCQPSYPRDMQIVGHQSPSNKDIIVHSITCSRLTMHTDHWCSPLIPVIWDYQKPAFRVAFFVLAQDRRGLVLDIAKQLRKHQCVLVTLNAEATLKFREAEVRFVVETYDKQEVLDILQKVRKVKNVINAYIDPSTTPTHIYESLQQLSAHQSSSQFRTEHSWNDLLAALPSRPTILTNPFDISRPAAAKMFKGRTADIKLMQRELCSGDNGKALILYGPRRSGKSSLCKNFLERCTRPPHWYVFHSLQNTRGQTEETMLRLLAEKVCYQLQQQLHIPACSWDDYSDRDPQKRFSHLVQNCLTQVPGSRLLLILDEFGGTLTSYEQGYLEQRFFTYWRDLISEIPQLSLVFVLPTVSYTFLESSELASAFSFTQSHGIDFLDEESAAQLLEDPLSAQGIAILPRVMKQAMYLTGRNPYYIALIGMQLIAQLNDEQQKIVVTDDDLQLAVNHFIETDSTQNFSFYQDEIRHKEEYHIIKAIVELTSNAGQPTVSLKRIAAWLQRSEESIRPHVERLRAGLLLKEHPHERSASLSSYSFTIELVRRWMACNRWFFSS